jgi:signal transduction histidine kinase/ActR/RegA family two-component response regulator
MVIDAAGSPLVAELCRTLASSMDVASMFGAVVRIVARGLNADVAQLWVQNDETNRLELHACANRSFEAGECPAPISFESFGIGRIARDRRSYVMNGVSDDPYLNVQAGVRSDQLVAHAGYPLLIEHRLLGVLSLYFCSPLPEDFAAQTEWLVDLIAIGIDRKLSNSAPHQHEADGRHSRKLELLGRLVAGVAHDFNNLITVLRGYSEIVMDAAGPDSPLRKDTREIHAAAERAASLTRQLLRFARQQPTRRQPMDVNTAVHEISQMLRRLFRENIELVNSLDPDAGTVCADASQFEQVMVNLMLNARDAMPQGGRLLIQTTKHNVPQEAVPTRDISVVGECIRKCRAEQPDQSDSAGNKRELSPGQYVTICVTDTGCGIEPRHLPRIFEPFFTTKESGRGTGLGLATVQDIVRDHGGKISVSSQPGHGTTFTIILPRAEESATSNYLLPQRTNTRPGTETILLVEDDEQLRAYLRDALRRAGYVVLEATDGDHATRLIVEHRDGIALLLADMVMPRVSGMELAAQFARAVAASRVLLMSGHADSFVPADEFLSPCVAFLQKPFSGQELLMTVRAVLDDASDKLSGFVSAESISKAA